jgi:hypothetical protein
MQLWHNYNFLNYFLVTNLFAKLKGNLSIKLPPDNFRGHVGARSTNRPGTNFKNRC